MNNNPRVVVGSQYCAPNQVDLVVSKNVKKLKDAKLVVSDMNGNIIFKVKKKFGLHNKRIIIDVEGNPLVILKGKIFSAHSRWNVFRGEKPDDENFIFTVKTTSMIQRKTELAVFLANNNSKEKVCDFLVKGSWSEKSCEIVAGDSSTIVAGDSSTIVAQMDEKITGKNLKTGIENFTVSVYSNVDQAFILSLVAILDAIREAKDAAKDHASRSIGGIVSNTISGLG